MQKMKSALVVTVLMVLNVAQALACSCGKPPPPQSALEQSKAVFSGKVVSVDVLGASVNVVKVEVDRIWQGTVGDTVAVKTRNSSAACGYLFTVGEQYLIYAKQWSVDQPNALYTSSCTRTQYIKRAEADLKALGEGMTVAEAAEMAANMSTSLARAPIPLRIRYTGKIEGWSGRIDYTDRLLLSGNTFLRVIDQDGNRLKAKFDRIAPDSQPNRGFQTVIDLTQVFDFPRTEKDQSIYYVTWGCRIKDRVVSQSSRIVVSPRIGKHDP